MAADRDHNDLTLSHLKQLHGCDNDAMLALFVMQMAMPYMHSLLLEFLTTCLLVGQDHRTRTVWHLNKAGTQYVAKDKSTYEFPHREHHLSKLAEVFGVGDDGRITCALSLSKDGSPLLNFFDELFTLWKESAHPLLDEISRKKKGRFLRLRSPDEFLNYRHTTDQKAAFTWRNLSVVETNQSIFWHDMSLRGWFQWHRGNKKLALVEGDAEQAIREAIAKDKGFRGAIGFSNADPERCRFCKKQSSQACDFCLSGTCTECLELFDAVTEKVPFFCPRPQCMTSRRCYDSDFHEAIERYFRRLVNELEVEELDIATAAHLARVLLETQLLSRFIPGAEGLYGYVEDAITTKLAHFTFWDFASIVSYGNPGVAVTDR